MNALEEKFYETAAREIADRKLVPAVMAKAFAEADGDEKRAIALYLKIRVEQLFRLHQEAEEELAAQRNKRDSAKEDHLLYPYSPIEVGCPACSNKEVINKSKLQLAEAYSAFDAKESWFLSSISLVCKKCGHAFRFSGDLLSGRLG